MKKVIGYTDSVNECECCGKRELKGTYCVEIDGVELYYGSVCAFKNHGISLEEQKEIKAVFTKEQKNAKLIEMHIAPLRAQAFEQMAKQSDWYSVKKIVPEFARVIKLRAKKYKIAI